MIKVGRIAFLNVEPFFHFWPSDAFTLVHKPPRQLGELAATGGVDAGPLPIVDCWRLEDSFEPVGRWCIASKERSGSVFVISKKPFAELNHATIGVTEDTSTSVLLATLLLRHRLGLDVQFRRGFRSSDDAWLAIGDQALGFLWKPETRPWPHVTDLATEWWNWHHRPFVFARWVARRAASVGDRARLDWLVGESIDKGLAALPEVARAAAASQGFAPDAVERYLKDFTYRMDADADVSEALFRKLLDEAGIMKGGALV